MYIYIFLFLVLITSYILFKYTQISSYNRDNKATNFIVFAGVCFILLIGMRAETVGSDTIAYAERYANTDIRVSMGFENPELGFDILQYICLHFFKLNFQLFLFVIATICIVSLFYFIYRYSVDELISVFVFIIFLLAMYMSGIRQSTAISFALVSLIMSDKRKPLLFILFLLLAYTIHNSAIIIAPFYFIWNINITRVQALFIFLIVVGAFFYGPYLSSIISHLAPARYEEISLDSKYSISGIVLIVSILIIVLSIIFLPVKNNGAGKYVLIGKSSVFFIMACAYLFFQIISSLNAQLWRLGFYFIPALIILIPYAVMSNDFFDQRSKMVIKIVVCVLCILYFFISIPGDVLQIDNFHFFWE